MKKSTVITILMVLALMFILAHISPSLAVRTKLFFDFHPITAITISVRHNVFQQSFDVDELNKMNAKIYEVTNSGATFDNGTPVHNFIVKRIGYFYYADYWGEM